MPARSQQQFKYIMAMRKKYGSRSKAPKDMKWVFDKDLTHDVKFKSLPRTRSKSIKKFESKEGDLYYLKNSIYFLGNKFISWLIKANPFLNEYYQSLKKQTKDLPSYGSSAGIPILVKDSISKIDLSEIKGTKVYRGLYRFINNWNLYTQEDFYFLTKDTLKKNDILLAKEIRNNGSCIKINNKYIKVCAKYDSSPELDDLINEIPDIFSDLEMEYNINLFSVDKNAANSKVMLKFDSRKCDFYGGKIPIQVIIDLRNNINRVLGILGKSWKFLFYIHVKYPPRDSRSWDYDYEWKFFDLEKLINDKNLPNFFSEIFIVFYRKDMAPYKIKHIGPSLSPDSWYNKKR